MTPRNWGLGLRLWRSELRISSAFHAEMATAVHRVIDVAEHAIVDGQPGAPWASFSIEVTEAYVRLVAELEQQKRTAAE